MIRYCGIGRPSAANRSVNPCKQSTLSGVSGTAKLLRGLYPGRAIFLHCIELLDDLGAEKPYIETLQLSGAICCKTDDEAMCSTYEWGRKRNKSVGGVS